jgi:signal peptidase I
VSKPPKVVLGHLPGWALRGLVLPAALVLLLHAFVFGTFRVSGRSMAETLAPGDFLIVSKLGATEAALSRRAYVPARGEIVVFRLPQNRSLYLIKRVVGVPGDSVSLADGTTHVVPAAHVFVVGDNREPAASSDSREWGDLPSDDVVGAAVFRLFPLRSAGALGAR